MLTGKDFILIGAILGLLAVVIGALGAHWLRPLMNEPEMASFSTASTYHLVHAVMLVFMGYYVRRKSGSRGLRISSYAFMFGTVLFSGTLYMRSLFHAEWISFLTPVGGLSLIIGWGALGVYALLGRI
ncbi:MAG: DUF423 domain-containing protein [Bacteroidetes bacterium]|jgi:uncharacterized membrane protein YgdD (TMEM256/DUF423 family)|nr:DUF423 domain-containing protein [Bacteroidota bacterium]